MLFYMFFMCENKQQQQFMHRKPRHVRKSTTLNFAHQGQNSFGYIHDVDNDADTSLIN